ncbi:MAG: DUF4442 domain-containing protein [Gammaproteobacteria bacterium]|nr:DUF4442 domain-containing protein [Gammaproteobacteria bacterium]
MKFTPRSYKFLINVYPPYLGTGIRVDHVDSDWKALRVSMSMRWYNRNAVGTHFGGSLYSMVDPHVMILLMQLLGNDFVVWDHSASIEYVKASKERVTAEIAISDKKLSEIHQKTRNGEKFYAKFDIDIIGSSGELVAKAHKTIYIRRKLPQAT